MTVSSILKFTVYGETYEEILFTVEERISEFFEVDSDTLKTKFNYEIHIQENMDMIEGSPYEAEAIVRGRNV